MLSRSDTITNKNTTNAYFLIFPDAIACILVVRHLYFSSKFTPIPPLRGCFLSHCIGSFRLLSICARHLGVAAYLSAGAGLSVEP